MNYNDEEYLALFRKIRNDENQDAPMLRETYQTPMLKETSQIQGYQNLNEVKRNSQPQNFNMNEFNIETRVNGQVMNRFQPNENLNEVKRFQKQERLDEILRIKEQEKINEIKRHEEAEKLRKAEEERRKAEEERNKLNESVNFSNAECVTLEMFNRARFNSMMLVSNSINNMVRSYEKIG